MDCDRLLKGANAIQELSVIPVRIPFMQRSSDGLALALPLAHIMALEDEVIVFKYKYSSRGLRTEFSLISTWFIQNMNSLTSKGQNGLINSTLIEKLNSSLKDSIVLTPDSEGYGESVIRWILLVRRGRQLKLNDL